MKKGFTLVEVLAVIILLGVLSLVIGPTIVNTLNNSKQNAYNVAMKNIEVSVRDYVKDNRDSIDELHIFDTPYTITLGLLAEGGYIELPIENPKSGENFDNSFSFYVLLEENGTYQVGESTELGTLPSLVLNGNNPDTVVCHATNNYTDPGAEVDDPVYLGVPTVYSLTTLNLKNAGSYLLPYTYNNVDGKSANKTRTVNITNPNNPVITIDGGDGPIDVEVGNSFVAPSATATDPCEGSLSVTNVSDVDTEVIGTYQVTYTATNSAGTSTDKVLTVNVIAGTNPELVLNGNNPDTLVCHATNNYTDPGAEVNDPLHAGAPTVYSLDVVSLKFAGDYMVGYDYSNVEGKTASASRTVTITNPNSPVITIDGGDGPIDINVGNSFTPPNATATDVCEGSLSVTNISTVNTNVEGSYTVTYTATNSVGTSTDKILTVNVNAIDTHPEWAYQMEITIDHTKIDEDLYNFPVRVFLYTSFDFTKARTDGQDIRFIDENFNFLTFERASHQKMWSGTDMAEYFVKIPYISSTTDTKFYLLTNNNTLPEETILYQEYITVPSLDPLDALRDYYLTNEYLYELTAGEIAGGGYISDVRVNFGYTGNDYITEVKIEGQLASDDSWVMVYQDLTDYTGPRPYLNFNSLNHRFGKIKTLKISSIYYSAKRSVKYVVSGDALIRKIIPTASVEGGDDKTAVWDSNYLMVNHMGENLDNSTSNNYSISYNLTSTGSFLIYGNNGSSANDYISFGPINMGNNFTISSYLEPESLNSGTYLTDGLDTNNFWQKYNYGTDSLETKIDSIDLPSLLYPNNGDFYHSIIYDGNTLTHALDLTLSSSATSTSFDGNIGNLWIMNDPGFLYPYGSGGNINEVRISNIVRSQAWLKAEMYDMKNDLVTFGSLILRP